MSTDRELLELAARAVGYDTNHRWNRERLEMEPPVLAMVAHDSAGQLVSTGWNPLDNNGDALRLAVKLGICIVFMEDSDSVGAEHSKHGVIIIEAMDELGTRRAIVRAAAEIGRTMP